MMTRWREDAFSRPPLGIFLVISVPPAVVLLFGVPLGTVLLVGLLLLCPLMMAGMHASGHPQGQADEPRETPTQGKEW